MVSVGARLGRYEIRSQIGAGGMGEVYLAQDTKLDRKVALKILPADLAANQDRMRRFVQEAKAAAALNHPSIAHIYEIGESDGTNFIAMEFVDGKTLREKIHGEKSELRVLLKHLLQVAEGLAKAHGSGIVHRDLKPDNIMITREGHAKILDFGLAKLIEGQANTEMGRGGDEEPTIALSPRLPVSPSVTSPGVVMGTVGYMSPEQAQAKTVDQRSDIFSFGCILYEAATGRKPFTGDSIVDTLHKIIHDPAPAITDFSPSASSELQRVIRKCLAK
ncbi:MAG TPA: serine/threonine-protein kinase [Pyrinomonadaceae bacterium]|nr:serine/threonine-protein kinase [Pyrinomonadaceae bacterium]